MKVYVDWENEDILTEKEYQRQMERERNPETMDWIGFEEWVKDNFCVSELLDFLCDGSSGYDRLRTQWASVVMKDTYCEVELKDEDDKNDCIEEFFPGATEEEKKNISQGKVKHHMSH